MTKSALGYLAFVALGILAGACSSDAPKNDSPCKTGAAACQCYPNKTCDAGLSCIGTLCIDLSGIAGSGSVFGGGGDAAMSGASGAAEIGDAGESNGGTSAGGSNNAGGAAGSVSNGGSISNGGSVSNGGSTSNGGSINTAGAGGAANPFPPNPAGCARVTGGCSSCCETSGVFALNSLAADATSKYVNAFNVDASAVTAEFTFATSDEVGAIFFHFSTPQNIGALSITGLATGGAMEIALVRATGKDGCIYPVVSGSLSSTPSSCWGLGAGPFAALPADQIEVRVRSLSSGRAALNVSSVQYAP